MSKSNLGFLPYDHGQHHFELIEAIGCFRLLIGFARDEHALDTHLLGAARPRGVSSDGQVQPVGDAEAAAFRGALSESVGVALSTYRRQMIVVFVSITEAATSDALRVLFSFTPESIKALVAEVGTEEFKPTVPLAQLIDATSLDELRASVVERAVAAASQGKNKRTVVRRLGKLFGRPIDREVEKKYLSLCARRNSIVHDHRKIELSDQDVEDACEVAILLGRELGRLVRSKSLPINDPHGFCAS